MLYPIHCVLGLWRQRCLRHMMVLFILHAVKPYLSLSKFHHISHSKVYPFGGGMNLLMRWELISTEDMACPNSLTSSVKWKSYGEGNLWNWRKGSWQ